MPTQLIAGLLEQFGCYLQTGSAHAAHRATLLLERLAGDPNVDPSLRARGEALAETLAALLERKPRSGTASRGMFASVSGWVEK